MKSSVHAGVCSVWRVLVVNIISDSFNLEVSFSSIRVGFVICLSSSVCSAIGCLFVWHAWPIHFAIVKMHLLGDWFSRNVLLSGMH